MLWICLECFCPLLLIPYPSFLEVPFVSLSEKTSKCLFYLSYRMKFYVIFAAVEAL